MSSGESSAPRRAGVFGGTFDPVHNGHLAIAAAAVDQLNLDLFLWVPNARSPLKSDGPHATFEHRSTMIALAIRGIERYRLSDIEGRRGGTSYTVDTLRELKAQLGDVELYLIVGADALSELHLWREYTDVCRLSQIVYMSRHGSEQGTSRINATRLNAPPIDVSSTLIRDRIGRGMPVDDLLPQSVLDYIRENRLYTV